MSEFQEQNIQKLKSECTVYTNTGQEYGINGSSYDHSFPALPDLKTLGTKVIEGVNGQCSSSSVSPKGTSKVQVSDINQVFTISAEDLKSGKKNEEVEYNRICSKIIRETGAYIEMFTSKNMDLTFIIKGKKANVFEAKRKIIEKFQTQATSEVHIPKEHHCQVMGKKGIRRTEIEQHTGARIHIPCVDDKSDIISVTGTRDSIEKAVHEIQMISDELSKKVFEKIKVNKIYHPFITGGHNKKLNKLMKETGVKIHVPPLSIYSNEIFISGDKEGVQLAIEKINQINNTVKNECATLCIDIPKQKHKFLLAQKGNYLQDLLSETNVSVEVPRLDSDEETVILRGLLNNINYVYTKLNDIINSTTSETIDCPKWMHRFLIGKNGSNLQKLMEGYEKIEVDFSENKIIVEGFTNVIPQVIDSFKKAIECYDSTELVVDSNTCKHIIGKNGTNVNRIQNDTGVIIDTSESDNNLIIIRIEGQKNGVELAKKEMEKYITKLANKVEKTISIDQRHYRAIIGSNGEKVKKLKDAFNVQIIFPTSIDIQSSLVKIRGLSDDVNKAFETLSKLAKELDEANYVKEIPIIKDVHKFVVGKGGINIKKIREETNTRIDLPHKSEDSGTIKVLGNKENVLIACGMIEKIQNEKGNVVKDNVVKSKSELTIINAGSKIIAKNDKLKEDAGDKAFIKGIEANVDKVNSSVTIKGNKTNVEKTKRKIEEMVKDLEDNFVETTISVPCKHHQYFVSHGADVINQIISEYNGVNVTFPKFPVNSSEILIKGRRDYVEIVKNKIKNIVIDLEQRISVEVIISQEIQKALMINHDLLNTIRRDFDVWIKFPEWHADDQRVMEDVNGNKNSDENRASRVNDIVTIIGSPNNCESAKQILIDNLPKIIELNVPSEYHGILIGTKGSVVQKLSKDFNVQIKIPNIQTASDIIKITGSQKNIDDVIVAIKEKMKLYDADKEDRQLRSYEIQMVVEPEFHPMIIGPKGQNIYNLRNKYSVQVNMPLRGENNNKNIITIVGYQQSAESARDEIQELVKKHENIYKEEIYIDKRFISKLFGLRGSNLLKIKDKYHVDIRILKSYADKPDLAFVYARDDGTEDDVLDCVDYLEMIQQDYLANIEANEAKANLQSSNQAISIGVTNQNIKNNGGLVMNNRTQWEKPHPDPNNIKDFPSFAGTNVSFETNIPKWGSGRR